MPDDFAGCVVVVTGGAKGIGRATAALFAQQGAQVVTLDKDPVPALLGVEALCVDIQDEQGVFAAIGQVGKHFGKIDVLVNNAGISSVGTVEDGSMEEWHRVYDINVLGPVRCTRAALPFLRLSGHGAIVNITSCTAISGFQQRALYSASKGALHALTFAMAADLIKEGIRVNCVSPGSVATPFMQKLAEAAQDPVAKLAEFNARQPMGRMVEAEEVALAVAYLAHPKACSTIGSVVTVDGGMAGLRLAR